jgi:murein DD-endopeptidase MepM/ murein hydrolase activator NlpD
MYRVLFAVAIAQGCAVTSTTPVSGTNAPAIAVAPAPLSAVTPQQVPGPFAVALAQIATSFDLPLPHAILDHLVQWQLDARDYLHAATDKLAALAANLDSTIPDITILTTQPIADTLSSGYGWRDDPIRHTWKFHSGTDFPSDPGTPVAAAGNGVVTFAGRQGGYGNVVYVDHGGGVVTLYGHMRRIETKKGATVAAGERIGQVGSTGRATGPHLHFEVRLDNRPVDPVMAMRVADLERDSPALGHLASFALSPDIQKHQRAFSDRHASRSEHEARPERHGRKKRAQVNW